MLVVHGGLDAVKPDVSAALKLADLPKGVHLEHRAFTTDDGAVTLQLPEAASLERTEASTRALATALCREADLAPVYWFAGIEFSNMSTLLFPTPSKESRPRIAAVLNKVIEGRCRHGRAHAPVDAEPGAGMDDEVRFRLEGR